MCKSIICSFFKVWDLIFSFYPVFIISTIGIFMGRWSRTVIRILFAENLKIAEILITCEYKKYFFFFSFFQFQMKFEFFKLNISSERRKHFFQFHELFKCVPQQEFLTNLPFFSLTFSEKNPLSIIWKSFRYWERKKEKIRQKLKFLLKRIQEKKTLNDWHFCEK